MDDQPDRNPSELVGYEVADITPPDPIGHAMLGAAEPPFAGRRAIVRMGSTGGWRGDIRIVTEPDLAGPVLVADEGDWYRAHGKPQHPIAVELSTVMVEVVHPATTPAPGDDASRWAVRVGRAADRVWEPWVERHPVPAREWPWLPGARVALTGGQEPVQRDLRAVSEPILGSDGAIVARVIHEAGYHRWWDLLPVMTWPIHHVWVE